MWEDVEYFHEPETFKNDQEELSTYINKRLDWASSSALCLGSSQHYTVCKMFI